MSIQPRTVKTILTGADLSWVAPEGIPYLHEMRSVVLDRSAFDLVTAFPNGYLPSGLVLGKITATGLYGPYTDAGAGGLDTAVGHLGSDIEVDRLQANTADELAPLYVKGAVDESNLPVGHGLTAAAKVDLAPRIVYV